MCKATAVYEDKLGKRRCGWCCYLPKSRDFTFWSDKQIKEKIIAGETVNGLKLTETGEVAVDETFTTAMLAKTGLATFIPIMDDSEDGLVSKYYAVVKVNKAKAGVTYELVTNRCGLETMSEAKLKSMMSLIGVGGVTLDKGKIVVHPSVQVEDSVTVAESAVS